MTKNPCTNTKHQFSDWLCSRADFDTLVTLTLKQGLPSGVVGAPIKIDQRVCEHTATLFRDRMSKKLLGNSKVRAGHLIPFAAFMEGDSVIRKHLHLMMQTHAQGSDLINLKRLVCKIAAKLDWVYNEIDVQLIRYGKPEFVANYCLKTGTDAFLPRASFLPTKS
ncbi:MAG: hypothetical protein JSR72_20200 [Proteobacteria bacterium]|nr:hypothetical protein [Pseudomonadota bacterium]